MYDAYEVDTPMHFLFDLEMLIWDKMTGGLTPGFFHMSNKMAVFCETSDAQWDIFIVLPMYMMQKMVNDCSSSKFKKLCKIKYCICYWDKYFGNDFLWTCDK